MSVNFVHVYEKHGPATKAVFLYFCPGLLKLPSQCYSNEPGNMGNLGNNTEIQPKATQAASEELEPWFCIYFLHLLLVEQMRGNV